MTLTGQTGNALTARLSGIATKEQADALRGVRLYVPRTRLPGLPDDEFYHADLIGLEVFDTGGTPLGRVHAVLNHGATDLLEIHAPAGPRRCCCPSRARPCRPSIWPRGGSSPTRPRA